VISQMWTPVVYPKFPFGIADLRRRRLLGCTCSSPADSRRRPAASACKRADRRLTSSCSIGVCKTRFFVIFVEMQGSCPSLDLG
jgi:hypothetical protein